jgi:hypothetical protein
LPWLHQYVKGLVFSRKERNMRGTRLFLLKLEFLYSRFTSWQLTASITKKFTELSGKENVAKVIQRTDHEARERK